jgi:hypothetical protein
MIAPDHLSELQTAYSDAKILSDGGIEYAYIPKLILVNGNNSIEMEALICPQMRDGYSTRLFLSAPVPNKGQNWTQHQILGRTWHSWSWKNVPANQSLVQILMGHLPALL